MAPYKVHKQGFLQLAPLGASKKQGQRKKWRRYWFILIEDPKQVGLVCFKSEKEFINRSKHAGFIRIDDCSSYHVVTSNNAQYANSLAVEKGQLRYLLGCETRYELHEWLAAIHQTMEEFRKKKDSLTVATQTGPGNKQRDSREEEEDDEEASEFEDQRREMRLSSSNPPSSESDRHSEGMPNGIHSDSEGQQHGTGTRSKRESWGPGYVGDADDDDNEHEQNRRPPIRRRRSRSLPQHDRNRSPPRDPPPPPPSELSMSRDHLPDMSDEDQESVKRAVDEAFKSIDRKTSGKEEGRRTSFTTFKPTDLSQPIFNTWHRGDSISGSRRMSDSLGSYGGPGKRAPVAAAIPLPHLGLGPHSHAVIERKPSVYSDDFVDSHPAPLPMHRRKMSAPANIILSDLPQLPPRKKSSESQTISLKSGNVGSPPPKDITSSSSPSPPPPAPPIPPHEPIDPAVKSPPQQSSFTERQPSLRQMTSKNFLSHLTAVTPYNKPKTPLQGKEKSSRPLSETPPSVIPPAEDYDSEQQDEFAKFSVTEIKRRLFGEGSGSPIAPKESFRPTIRSKSQGRASVEPEERNHGNQNGDSVTDGGPQVQLKMASRPLPPTPSSSAAIENPNYGQQMDPPPSTGIPKSSSSTFSSHTGMNGHHHHSEQNGHSRHSQRAPWMGSSQTINDFRLSADPSHLHSNPHRGLQPEDRSASHSSLKTRAVGKVTNLDNDLFQRPFSATPRSTNAVVNRYNHVPPTTTTTSIAPQQPRSGYQIHLKSPPRTTAVAHPPPVTANGRGPASASHTNAPPTRPHPHMTSASWSLPRRGTPLNQPPSSSTTSPAHSLNSYRDPKRAPKRNRPPVSDRPGRTTPTGTRRTSVFDTTVEWDETANQTVLSSLC